MEAAAQFWFRSHDEILFILCKTYIKQKMGDDCEKIVSCLANPVDQISTLQNLSELEQRAFQNALTQLCQAGVVITEPEIALVPQTIITMLCLTHFITFAQRYYIIPQDKDLIRLIIKKVIEAPTLTIQKLADTLATEDATVDRLRILDLTKHLLQENVLYQTDDDTNVVVFNTRFYYSKLRLEAIEELVQYQDHRVTEVIREIFSSECKGHILDECEPEHIEREELIEYLCGKTDMSQSEILGVFSILASPEICLLSTDYAFIQPRLTLYIYRMKRIAALLSEIGYPLARRVINMLLKHDQIETNKFCDMLMMPKEDALVLLEKLKKLGIVACDYLEDAPHTTLKRKYGVWKINPTEAFNNSGAYLLAVLGALLFEAENEKAQNEEILSKSEDLLAASEMRMRKVMENRLTVLNNSLKTVIKKYIEIHQI